MLHNNFRAYCNFVLGDTSDAILQEAKEEKLKAILQKIQIK